MRDRACLFTNACSFLSNLTSTIGVDMDKFVAKLQIVSKIEVCLEIITMEAQFKF